MSRESTKFKKGDPRLIGNQYAKGSKPNKTSFKKGGHASLKTEFKKGDPRITLFGEKNPSWRGGKPTCKSCNKTLNDYRSKICKSCLKLENHPNWLGGKSFEEYGFEFKSIRKEIRERDNFQCQECGYPQKNLNYALVVHHIDYNKKNNKPENLIALCRQCHVQTNYKREDWTNYFKQKILCKK